MTAMRRSQRAEEDGRARGRAAEPGTPGDAVVNTRLGRGSERAVEKQDGIPVGGTR